MNILSLIQTKDVDEIKKFIQSGEIIRLRNKIISKIDHETYLENTKQSEYFDMLQGVKKVLLKLRLSAGKLLENLVNSVKIQEIGKY